VTDRPGVDLLLVCDSTDRASTEQISRGLRAADLKIDILAPTRAGPDLEVELRSYVDTAVAVSVAVGPAGLTHPIRIAGSVAADLRKPLFVLLLPGGNPNLAQSFSVPMERLINLQRGVDDAGRLGFLGKAVIESRGTIGSNGAEPSREHATPDEPPSTQSAGDAEVEQSAQALPEKSDELFRRLNRSALAGVVPIPSHR
jgi:hypothetical protein